MKNMLNAPLALMILAVGILVGRYVQYYEVKNAEEARIAVYEKIIADHRRANVALDHLKATIASKCNDVYDKKRYLPFEGAYLPRDPDRLCWAGSYAQ